MQTLSVPPMLAARALGRSSWDAVERELARRGVHELRLLVIASNVEGFRFYERRGLATVSHL